jgi:MFS superfamily sulfate permease-like transporter
MLVLARIARLGFVADFISTPVLTGFKAGIGLVIVLDQVPKLLGTHITKHGFFPDLLSVAQHVPETSLLTLGVAVATLVVLVGMDRLWPASPAPLVAVGLGIAASWFFGLQGHGVSIVGKIPQGLPSITLPDLSLVIQLVPAAAGMALMSFTESIAAARRSPAPAIRRWMPIANSSPSAQPTRRLAGGRDAGGRRNLADGGRHAAGGRSQRTSMVTGGCASADHALQRAARSLAERDAGDGRHRLLGRPDQALRVPRHPPRATMEFRWAVAAMLGVLLFGTLQGIVIAILMSLIGLSSQAARPTVHVIGRKRGADVLRPVSPEFPDDETFEGLLILRPEGRLFFANAQSVAEQIQELVSKHKPRVVAVDMSRVPDIEYSALQALIEGEKRTTERGTTVWLAGMNPSVLEVVRRTDLAQRLGRERMLFNARMAIERYQAMLDREAAAARIEGVT